MDAQVALLMAVLTATTLILASNRVPADAVAIGLLVTLQITGLLTPDEAFAGFGSPTFMLLLGLFILTAALSRTGIVDMAGWRIARYSRDNPRRLLILVMGAAASMSTFVSNAATAAFFLPVVLGLARRTKVSASRLLLPMAFATSLASSLTLISTSTNVVISGLMHDFGLERMGTFELLPVGLPVLVVGLSYMYFVGQRLIPSRASTQIDLDELGKPAYTTEVVVMPESRMVGGTLGESGLRRNLDLKVLRIVRNRVRYIEANMDMRLDQHNVLLIEATRDELLRVKDVVGIELKADAKFATAEAVAANPKGSNGSNQGSDLVELLIHPG